MQSLQNQVIKVCESAKDHVLHVNDGKNEVLVRRNTPVINNQTDGYTCE
jgi:hypothetical protein